jgi:hypothetical protein
MVGVLLARLIWLVMPVVRPVLRVGGMLAGCAVLVDFAMLVGFRVLVGFAGSGARVVAAADLVHGVHQDLPQHPHAVADSAARPGQVDD